MQDITEQDHFERVVLNGEVRAVEGPVIDRSFGCIPQIDADNTGIEHCRKVVVDVSAAATDIEYARSTRNHTGNLLSHVVSAADFASSSLPTPTSHKTMPQT